MGTHWVLELTEFAVVHAVEEDDRHGAHLDDGGQAAVPGIRVLVREPPVGAAAGARPVHGVLGPPAEPARQLSQLDLGQRGVR